MNYNGKNYNGGEIGLTILGAIALIITIIFIAPWLSFWVAYFGGWIAKVTIGTKLVAALNLLFNTDYFTKDMLPMMAGALGWIGGFFKSVQWQKKKD